MPANSGYFVAAYAVTAVVYLLYGLSIIVRVRALEHLAKE